MKLIYVLDYVFRQTPDGRVWTDTSYDAAFWRPYLEVYSHVTVVSRTEPVATREPRWKEVEGTSITVAALPLYRGAVDYVRRAGAVHDALHRIFLHPAAVVLRMPSNLARCAAQILERAGRPYAVDVVGDPHAALAPGVVQMPGRAVLRQIFTHAQRELCQSALGVAYVAQGLIKLYPPAPEAASLVCSDVRLGPEWLCSSPRVHSARRDFKLLTVATLSQTYKGIDVLLRALKLTQTSGLRFTLTIVGTGKYRDSLEATAAELGVGGKVRFAGTVPWGPELKAYFDAADLFVLPSRVEVMPRALLEAMARALPAIATDVGAVSEVLNERFLVPAGNAWALAERLVSCVSSPATLDAMSAANVYRAEAFKTTRLLPRWLAFHSDLHATFSAQPVRNAARAHHTTAA